MESSNNNDRDPWISRDGQDLYYSYQTGNSPAEIFYATRDPTTGEFQSGAMRDDLDNAATNTHPSLTADEKKIVWSSDRTDGVFRTYVAVRNSSTGQFESVQTADGGMGAVDPRLNSDGSRLYSAQGTDQQHIAIALVDSTDPTRFGAPTLLDLPVGDATADPAPSPGESILVFSALTSALNSKVRELWYARRTSASSADPSSLPAFDQPRKLAALSVPGADEMNPALSDDGCDLYFAQVNQHEAGTNREGVATLYVAEVVH